MAKTPKITSVFSEAPNQPTNPASSGEAQKLKTALRKFVQDFEKRIDLVASGDEGARDEMEYAVNDDKDFIEGYGFDKVIQACDNFVNKYPEGS